MADTTEPRDISAVIDAVLALIPSGHATLVAQLTSIKQSSFFTAPEIMWKLWHRGTDALVASIGESSEPWQIEVRELWSRRERVPEKETA